MRRHVLWILAVTVLLGAVHASAEPVNFLYSGDGLTPEVRSLLARPDVEGVQILYNWRQLEPRKNRYDFSAIEQDLATVAALHKKLFVQIQDRFFDVRNRGLPDYVLDDPLYGGGLAPQFDNPGEGKPQQQGWVAIQWNPAVRERFQALLKALARRFDGRIMGMNLPETAIGIDRETDRTGFTCDGYAEAALANINAARAAFKTSHVVQYANFWPCEWNNDHGYMERIFKDAAAKGYGLGGPDIVPYRKGQMKNSYPFFHAYRGRLSIVAMAIQEPTLSYTNPKTGKPFTRAEFVDFATNYLGVDVIFWTVEAPWLRESAH